MNNVDFRNLEGILIDLDGVMYIEDELIPGAVEAIKHLNNKGIKHRFLTNTTVRSKENLYNKMKRLNIPVSKDEIISPPGAASKYLREQGNPSIRLEVMDETKEDFAEFRITKKNPDFVVIGKIGKRWSYDLMNELFTHIINGSSLIALHKDRYTMGEEDLDIEFGAFIAGLEYSTGKEALIMGKPSKTFYQSAIIDIGVNQEKIIMIGDDLISDIQGAQNAGIKGILVKTGKYRKELLEQSPIKPDQIVSSIYQLTSLI